MAYTTNDWNSGFTGTVTVTNTGGAPVSPWTLRWSFTGGQRVTQSWSAGVAQSGADVTATGESWSTALPAGGSVSFGFNATHPGSNPRPAAFTLNGAPCTAG